MHRGDPTSREIGTFHGFRVVQTLQREGPLTKRELEQRCQLSRPTLDKIIESLRKRGILNSGEHRAPSSGRPPLTYAFNPLIKVCVGVDLEMPALNTVITDLDGEPLWEKSQSNLPLSDPSKTLGLVAHQVKQGLASLRIPKRSVLGVGLGIPAFMNGPNDTVSIQAHNLPRWKDVAVKRELYRKLGIAVHVDNDVNFMALAENLRRGQGEPVLLYLALRQGTNQDLRMGSAILFNGQVYRGAYGNAASLQGMYVKLRKRGDLIGAIRKALGQDRNEAGLLQALNEHFFLPTVNMILMLDPSLVVIHARLLDDKRETFIATCQRILRKHLPAAMAARLRIEASVHAHRPGANGAARFVAQQAFAEPKELIAKLSS